MATTKQNPSLATMLEAALPDLQKIAPSYVNVSRLIALAIEAQQRNPLLAKCSLVSVVNFCKKCAEAGTDRIGAGGMWAVPFWNEEAGCYEMVPMPDWRLLIEKTKKAKAILHATAEAVYRNDEFRYERGLSPALIHVPKLGDKGELVAAYSVYQLPDGSKDFVVMDKKEIDNIRARSKATKNGPWVTDFAEMAKKTVVRRAMKLFEGASIELTKLLDIDNAVSGFGEIMTRAEVKMPTALPSPQPKAEAKKEEVQSPDLAPSPAPAKPATPPAATAAESDNGVQTIEIVMPPIGSKADKRGKLRYYIKVDGIFYSTYDTKLADTMQSAEGIPCVLSYKIDGDFRTIVAVEPEREDEPQADKKDDLPY